MTQHQIKRLKLFSEMVEEKEASKLIPEVTDVLNNMFRSVEYIKQEAFVEKLSKSVITTITDTRVQIAFYSIFIVIIIHIEMFFFSYIMLKFVQKQKLAIMFIILVKQIRLFKFSIPTFILILLLSSFVISIVNNHFKLIQVEYLFQVI